MFNSKQISKFGYPIVIVILTISCIIFRNPYYFDQPEFWAEDGSIFFKEAFLFGWKTFLMPFAGYLHLVPRLFAFISLTFFDLEDTPLVFRILSLFVFTLSTLYLWYRLPFSNGKKGLFILCITTIFCSPDMFGNALNLQWTLALLILIPFLFPDSSTLKSILDSFIILIVGLTGPFCVIFLPIVGFAYWINKLHKSKKNWQLISIYLLCCCIQLYFLMNSNIERRSGSFSVYYFLIHYIYGIYYASIQILASWPLINFYNPILNLLVLVFILTYAFILFTAKSNNSQMAGLLVSAGFLVLTFSFYAFRLAPNVILPPINHGWRYFRIPTLFLALSGIMILKDNFWSIFLTFIYLMIGIISFNKGMPPTKPKYLGWKENMILLRSKKIKTIPVQPEGWLIEFVK